MFTLPSSYTRIDRVGFYLLLSMATVYGITMVMAAWGFTTDDAYITLRYAKNLAGGHGLVWNIGQPPVEGYSNFSFVLLGAACLRVGLDPIIAFKIVCILGLGLACFCTHRLARRVLEPTYALLPCALLLQYRGVTEWAVSGLETTFYMGIVSAALLCVVRALEEDGRIPGAASGGEDSKKAHLFFLSAAVLLAFAGMTRPEAPLVFICVVAGIKIWLEWRFYRSNENPWSKPFISFVVCFLALYGTYFLWRIGFFGKLLPNTVYCKFGAPKDPWQLVGDFYGYGSLFLIVALAGFRWRVENIIYALLVAVFGLMIWDVHPIIGHRNRHVLVVFPYLLILGVVGYRLILGAGILRHVSQHRPLLAIVPFLLLAPPLLIYNYDQQRIKVGYYSVRERMRDHIREWINERTEPSDKVVFGDCGRMAYGMQVQVIDLYCLNDPNGSTDEIKKDPTALANYIIGQRPKYIILNFPQPRKHFEKATELFIAAGYLKGAMFRDPDFNPDGVIVPTRFAYGMLVRPDAPVD